MAGYAIIIFLILSSPIFSASFEDIIPSTPEELFSLTSNLLVEGCVSALSGQLSLSETDLHVKGNQDLFLKRTYVPPQILGCYESKDTLDRFILGQALLQLKTKGWIINPHLMAGYNRNSQYFQVRDPAGFTLEFAIKNNKGILQACYGCSNLLGDEPSSANDIRNISLFIEEDFIKIIWPSDIQRFYRKHSSSIYRLEKEILPNGKALKFEYNEQGFVTIFSCDPEERWIYGSIIQKDRRHYTSSDGQEVILHYELREIKGEFKKRNYKEKATYPFLVMSKAFTPIYTNTVSYNERTLLNYYDAKPYPISCDYYQQKNLPVRIRTFSTPSGTISFSYDPPIAGRKGGSTTVTYLDGAVVVYRFNQLLLLEVIENWLDNKLINKKTYTYDSKQHIQDIETLDGTGNLLVAKRFECDASGNPIVEKTEGDFGVFSIRRTFDRNRLIFEARDDGLTTELTYLGNTHLITSKTIFDSGKKLRKTIYSYDKANNLIQIEEEGKTKTYYRLYNSSPHLHRSEWEEQTTWNGELIRKIRYVYDQWGNITREEHFGSDGKFAYTLCRIYNEKGELLEETNPVGETAHYNYDLRGRCIYEEPIANNLVIHRTFDAKGRLINLQENERQTCFTYNNCDELIEKTDYLGYSTKYHYHPIHGKPDCIEEPPGMTQITYDSYGREIEIKNAYTALIQKNYNGYGYPIKIIDPDGGIELFNYFPNGKLKSYINPDGLETSYSYDGLGRCLVEKIGDLATFFQYDGYHLRKKIDPAGFTTEYQYDLAGHKIEENREGRITRYTYDALGFLSEESRRDRKISFTNDSLGRLLKKSIDETLETTWTYDRAGNISSITTGGKTTFIYDPHNRLIQKISPEQSITLIEYEIDSQTLLKKILDPSGIETIEAYNPQGKLLSRKIQNEPVLHFTYDQAFRLVSQDHIEFEYSLGDKRISIKEGGQRITRWEYTPGGLILTKQKPDNTHLNYIYDQGRLIQLDLREFQYDALNRIVGGTGFSRILDAFGNIKREEWTNGLWIETDYDDWDRPIERRLPDFSRITYRYEGPFLKEVIRFDSHQKKTYSHIYKKYDVSGNPLIEQGACTILSEYDLLSRKVNQKTPYFQEAIEYDQIGNLIRKGSTTYTYDALSQMTSQSERFTATYDAHYNLRAFNGRSIKINSFNQIEEFSYDLNGNLLKPGFIYDKFDQLIEAEGETYVYDALGRRTQKGDLAFLYCGDEEIASFENGKLKELKISGLEPIAIEIQGKPYQAITDVQGTIRLLIDTITLKIHKENICDAFGGELTDAIPYAYFGKRYDASIGLVYFGKRYYDPSLRRWLTPDPVGPFDHSNLYQYLFNNPYSYRDLNGEFAFAIPLIFLGAEFILPTLSTYITALVYSSVAGAITYSGYKLFEVIDRNYSSMNDYYYSKDLTANKDVGESDSSDELTTPPYRGDKLGDNPTKPPADGFEWKGKGKPGSKEGSWYNSDTGESLHPDLNHPPPIKPHWDYEGPNGEKARLNIDGTWKWKR
jgi:RHS repeat-associated protein